MPKYPIKRGIVCGTVLVCLSTVPSGADQAENYRSDLNQIGQQIKEISRNLNANKALLKSERDKLADVEQKIHGFNSRLLALRQQINLQEQAGKDMDGKIAALRQAQQRDLKALGDLIQRQHRQGRPNFLKMLLNQENPYAVGRLSNYYEIFRAALQTKLQALQGNLQVIRSLQLERERQLVSLRRQQQQQAAEQQKLNRAKTERSQRVARLDQKVAQSADKLDQLRQDRDRLNQLLKEIVAKAAEMQSLEDARIEQQRRQQAAGSTAPAPQRALVKGGFIKQRGRLSYPVTGSQKYRFGKRLPESGMRAQGVFFNTSAATPIQAIFRGRVLFADYLKGYGLLLIIDHGDDHISLYGHNETLYKKVGDIVQTGETVALTGVSGGLKSPGLYFEIRRNATPVDPALWCR